MTFLLNGFINPIHIHIVFSGEQEAVMNFMECFVSWFEENCKTREEKITYFKKYSPPPRWLATIVEYIWDVEGWNEPHFDYTPYFKQLAEYGFEGTADYQNDLDNEKWID